MSLFGSLSAAALPQPKSSFEGSTDADVPGEEASVITTSPIVRKHESQSASTRRFVSHSPNLKHRVSASDALTRLNKRPPSLLPALMSSGSSKAAGTGGEPGAGADAGQVIRSKFKEKGSKVQIIDMKSGGGHGRSVEPPLTKPSDENIGNISNLRTDWNIFDGHSILKMLQRQAEDVLAEKILMQVVSNPNELADGEGEEVLKEGESKDDVGMRKEGGQITGIESSMIAFEESDECFQRKRVKKKKKKKDVESRKSEILGSHRSRKVADPDAQKDMPFELNRAEGPERQLCCDKPRRENAKCVGFADSAGHESSNWKMIVELGGKSGSGQISCAKKTCADLSFISVHEVEASQMKYLKEGNCIHMREGSGVERCDVMRLQSGDKVNRFVDMGPTIGSKCNLFKQLIRMRSLFPDIYSFFPPTWNFPDDLEHFVGNAPKDKIYLLKPTVGSQGKGIRLAAGPEVGATYGKMCKELPPDLELDPGHSGALSCVSSSPKASPSQKIRPKTSLSAPLPMGTGGGGGGNIFPALKSPSSKPSPSAPTATSRHMHPHVCVQECIDPALLGRSKFDLRVYVLLESVMPLKAHVCRSAMLRKCMEEYRPVNAGEKMQKFSMLTNTSINKKYKPEYMPTAAGKECKIPLHTVFNELEANGIDRDSMWAQVERIVALTLIAVEPRLQLQYRSCLSEEELLAHNSHRNSKCFQMLGFDIMLDSSGKANLLEVNTHPSFSWDTSIDATIKRPTMAGCLAIVCGHTISHTIYNNDTRLSTIAWPAALSTVTEFHSGGAFSFFDKDGVMKPGLVRRDLAWLHDLYTEVNFGAEDGEEDYSSEREVLSLGGLVLKVFLGFLHMDAIPNKHAEGRMIRDVRTTKGVTGTTSGGRGRDVSPAPRRCLTARTVSSSPTGASTIAEGAIGARRAKSPRSALKKDASSTWHVKGGINRNPEHLNHLVSAVLKEGETDAEKEKGHDGISVYQSDLAEKEEGCGQRATFICLEEDGVEDVLSGRHVGDRGGRGDDSDLPGQPETERVKEEGGREESIVTSETALGPTGVVVLYRALRRMCIPEEALERAFRLRRRSVLSRLTNPDTKGRNRPPSSSSPTPHHGNILDISKSEYRQHEGKSMSFEAFYDGLYTVAFNVHHLAQDDSDSDSEEEADTLYDVLEGILSGLLVVISQGCLPPEVQAYVNQDCDHLY